jgi:hypothetical protein
MDIIHFFYWESPEQGALAREPIYHPVTKECIGQRPTNDKLSLLREGFLKIAKIYLTNDPTEEEVHVVMYTFI